MSGTPNRRLATRLLVAAIVYGALIFAVSHVPGNELAKLNVNVWDKAAHASEYLPLGAVLMGWLVARRRTSARAAPWREVAITIGIVLAYGALDEVHQSFVPGRQPAVADVAADVFGGAVGAALLLALSRRSARRRPEPLDELEAREEEQPVELLAGDPRQLDDRRDRE
jgi:uncharacterized protein (TIGR03382 family)